MQEFILKAQNVNNAAVSNNHPSPEEISMGSIFNIIFNINIININKIVMKLVTKYQ